MSRLQVPPPGSCKHPHWKAILQRVKYAYFSVQIHNLTWELQVSSVSELGKWPRNISGSLQICKTSLLHIKKCSVGYILVHWVDCQLCCNVSKLKSLYGYTIYYSMEIIMGTLAKAAVWSQRNHTEQDMRKHARPVCKTNGSIILMEWQRWAKFQTSQWWKTRRNCW